LQPMTEEETTAYLQENKKKDINYKLSQLEGDELEAVCMEMIEETEKNIKKQIEEAYS